MEYLKQKQKPSTSSKPLPTHVVENRLEQIQLPIPLSPAPSDANRIAELEAQITDLQVAMVELFEGGAV